jgi:hypothetical protein
LAPGRVWIEAVFPTVGRGKCSATTNAGIMRKMQELRFVILVVSIGWVGWLAYYSYLRTGTEEKSWRSAYFIFLTGIGITSICLFLSAILGIFNWYAFLVLALLFVFLYIAVQRRYSLKDRPAGFLYYTVACIFFALFSLGISKILKPAEAVILADDASIYLSTAIRLAETGGLVNEDPFVQQMSQAEKEALFRNRFTGDKTGVYARFPGGVSFVDLESGITTFSFYHLFPVWLAFGIKAIGIPGFLILMNFFLTMSLLSLYFLAREFGGVLLAISLPVILFFFYPQVYFSRMPYSELLAQALFLSGMWIIVSGLKNHPSISIPRQTVAGTLWGALLLTRFEIIFILLLCFIVVLFLFPEILRSITKSKRFFLWLIFCALLGFYHQVRRGEYWYIVDFTLGPASASARRLFLQYPFVPLVLFALLFTLAVFLLDKGKFGRLQIQKPWRRRLLGLAILIVLLAFVPTRYWSPELLRTNITWLFLYTPPVIYFVIHGGLFLYIWFHLRNRIRPHTLFIAVMIGVPLCIFFINPMVSRIQPIGIRRFIPMLYPLMFLASFSGWYRLLSNALIQNHFVRRAVFGSVVLVTIVFFAAGSWHLLRSPLYDNVIPQIAKLNEQIPSDSLVIIRDTEAGIHMQLPLQYLLGRNTIVLPFQQQDLITKAATEYLKKKLEQNESITLLVGRQPTIKEFPYKSLAPAKIEFSIVPVFKEDEFPSRTERVFLNWNLLVLQDPPARNVIHYDDPKVKFIDFFEVERNLRWTSARSEIAGFRFPTNRKDTLLVLSTAFPNPIHSVESLQLRIAINERKTAKFLKNENNDFHFLLPADENFEITNVRIESKTFRPNDRGINPDQRSLGVPFVRLTFSRID